jgi:hypothetical protein
MINAKESLEDKIVVSLGNNSHATAEQIKLFIPDSYSIQAIYQSLKKLQEQGVVVKVKDNYSLKLSWVIGLRNFTQNLENQYVQSLRLNDIAPLFTKKSIWRFNSLISLNNFWAQLLLILIQESKTKTVFDWTPEPWYYLAHTEQEQKYLSALKSLSGKVYMVIGGKTYLHKSVEQYLNPKFVEYSFSDKLFEKDNDTDFSVIDDYILTVSLNKNLLNKIKQLYKNTKDQQDVDINKVLEIFFGEFNAKMTLEYNPAKAKVIRKKFIKHFGINI